MDRLAALAAKVLQRGTLCETPSGQHLPPLRKNSSPPQAGAKQPKNHASIEARSCCPTVPTLRVGTVGQAVVNANGSGTALRMPMGQPLESSAAGAHMDGLSNPITNAQALGWSVIRQAWGVEVDTRGKPSDQSLLDRLHISMIANDAGLADWPQQVLADPAKVVAHRELDDSEQETAG